MLKGVFQIKTAVIYNSLTPLVSTWICSPQLVYFSRICIHYFPRYYFHIFSRNVRVLTIIALTYNKPVLLKWGGPRNCSKKNVQIWKLRKQFASRFRKTSIQYFKYTFVCISLSISLSHSLHISLSLSLAWVTNVSNAALRQRWGVQITNKRAEAMCRAAADAIGYGWRQCVNYLTSGPRHDIRLVVDTTSDITCVLTNDIVDEWWRIKCWPKT